LTKTFVQP